MEAKKQNMLLAILLSFLMCTSLVPMTSMTAIAGTGDVTIDETNFPDANFRKYVKETFDKDKDGILSQVERERVYEIVVKNIGVKTLKGLEFFPNLEFLYCQKNDISNIDVSKNQKLIKLYCDENQITGLDVSKNPKLEELGCSSNKLAGLDVSKNQNLNDVYCNSCSLTALDVSKNTYLRRIECIGNKLTRLDISKNLYMEFLACNNNQLTTLELSEHPNLQVIECNNNQLTTLDVSKIERLGRLFVDGNHLTSLDLESQGFGFAEFSGKDNEYDIEVGELTRTFDLTSLPGNFVLSKAYGWNGGTVSGNILTVDNTKPAKVTYRYKANSSKTVEFTLNVNYDKEEYTVSVDKNGGSGSMPEIKKKDGETYVLPPCTLIPPDGKEFKTWEVNGEEKAVGDKIQITGDTTLKPIWKDKADKSGAGSQNPSNKPGKKPNKPGNSEKKPVNAKIRQNNRDRNNTSNNAKNPKTGESSMLSLYALAILASGGGLIGMRRKSRKEQ